MMECSVKRALEWAFSVEKAEVVIPETAEQKIGRGFGMEYVMLERAKLGVQVDTFRGESMPHSDALIIAAVVSTLPQSLGGLKMALRLAQVARTGLVPDWMQGAVPRIVPRAWAKRNQYGERAKAERIGVWVEEFFVPHPRNPRRKIWRTKRHEIMWTPCTWSPSPGEIRQARKEYLAWWHALDDVRVRMAGVEMTKIRLNAHMPPKKPWATSSLITRATRAAGSRPASTP